MSTWFLVSTPPLISTVRGRLRDPERGGGEERDRPGPLRAPNQSLEKTPLRGLLTSAPLGKSQDIGFLPMKKCNSCGHLFEEFFTACPKCVLGGTKKAQNEITILEECQIETENDNEKGNSFYRPFKKTANTLIAYVIIAGISIYMFNPGEFIPTYFLFAPFGLAAFFLNLLAIDDKNAIIVLTFILYILYVTHFVWLCISNEKKRFFLLLAMIVIAVMNVKGCYMLKTH